MADVVLFNSWCTKAAQILRGETTAPNSGQFYVILLNGATVGRTSTLSAIVANEVSVGGYTRKNVNLVALGSVTYNGSTNRAEYPTLNITYTASGASFQYDNVILIANGNSTIGNSTGDPVWYYSLTPQTIPDGASQTISIQNWGFANIGSASGT